ncbi:hypothetical protein [Aquisediminimonas profunda]|uniref:hypothetical protein n=1 Tax=Aquisediminimonas profunda TaxID=1550733 RepID=UPI001C626F17|nr:hypothetical protein [Aquisediminimonas profunda]
MSPVSRFLNNLTLRPQGFTLVVAGFLPIFAIVTMFPVVASMIQHFSADPHAAAKVPLMVTAPGLGTGVPARESNRRLNSRLRIVNPNHRLD